MAVTAHDGTIIQSSLNRNENDYGFETMNSLIMGVVFSLLPSDHVRNSTAAPTVDQRGTHWEATVVALNDGWDTPWVIPNVAIVSPGASGVDNFHEELPRPCTGMIDGSPYNPGFRKIDVTKLNGDYCLVQFIGGHIDQPVMTHWFPHPGNFKDSATSGKLPEEVLAAGQTPTLAQSRRLFKRYNGAKLVITPEGDLFVDTNESNSKLEGRESGLSRESQDGGGRVQVDMKEASLFEVNFNPIVQVPETYPSLPRKNPPSNPTVDQEREDSLTRVTAEKDNFEIKVNETRIELNQTAIEAIAKEVVKLIAADKIQLEADEIESIGDTIKEQSSNILMGSQPDFLTPQDGVVTGRGVDPFTGKTYAQLLNISLKVKAEK